ncbi:hypothetical protein V9W64_10750 [Neisseria leonii]|uniref:Uncharacterized protein n=1 Tax=Neisseria leonii TaxID=2995413 RepID=A0A9X4DZG9_9NEIS|nr:hypothetical protein [Neisseria sp. 51.81]MDD9326720.1 hypothetical protein [Neisseria sp. 51.81]
MSRTATAFERQQAHRLCRSGLLNDDELNVMDMILMSHDAQEEIEKGWFDDFKLIELKYSEAVFD